MTKKELKDTTERLRQQYPSYKVQNLAVKLLQHGVSDADVAYILQGGEKIKIRPYAQAQTWLGRAMDRMEERLPMEKAEQIRQDSACCLSGLRAQRARRICADYPTVEARFDALSKEKLIIGGHAWRENDDFLISFWDGKPADGYACACLKHVPETEPMNKLWCACCAGHIRQHFETALGVNAVCHCESSVLSSCGKEGCVFRLRIVSPR